MILNLKKIVKLFIQKRRTKKSISNEFSVFVANYMKENFRLRKEPKDTKKKNEFLKKAGAFFKKEIN